jgi:radical SAM superfamily enzyme YgiQ (UPF0313 family)
MTTKLLFIIPPNITFENFINPLLSERTSNKNGRKFGDIKVDMPLGILSMSSYLKKHVEDIEIKLIDFNICLNELDEFNYLSFYEFFYAYFLLFKIRNNAFQPDIIGISTLFSPAYKNMIDVANAVKQEILYFNSFVIAGGGIPTNISNKIFQDSHDIDALCYGEGELSLLELIQAKNKYDYLKNSKSWVIKSEVDKKLEFNFIENIDEIPIFDYDLIDVKKYNKNSLHTLFPLLKDEKSISLISSRGCTHNCLFCSSHTVHGKYIRTYSIERIKNDIKYLKENYNIKVLTFFDDHFLFDKERALEILQYIKELDLKAFFPSSLALYALDENILKALKNVGVDSLILSVESGSDKVLREIIHKPLNLKIVKRVIEDCHKLNIAIDISILIGFPKETKQDIEDTRQFLKKLNATWYRISVATPLVGSEMLDICLKNNYIKGDYLACDFKRAIVETLEFTTEWLQEKIYELNLELNFVENNDFKNENYERALHGFENTIKVKDDHAFAYHYAAKCCEKLMYAEKYIIYKNKANKLFQESIFWNNYFEKFDLKELKLI